MEKTFKFIILVFITIFISCNDKDLFQETDDLNFRQIESDILKIDYQSRGIHEKIGLILSKVFQNLELRKEILAIFSRNNDENILLFDFLNNTTLNSKFISLFNEAAIQRNLNEVNSKYFIEVYLKNYPGTELGIHDLLDREIAEIPLNENFDVAIIYDKGDYIEYYNNGVFLPTNSPMADPSKLTLSIQEEGSFYVSDGKPVKPDVIGFQLENFLSDCDKLTQVMGNYQLNEGINLPEIKIGDQTFKNPLFGKSIWNIREIIKQFNENCGTEEVVNPSSDPRSSCDRDAIRNKDEFINGIRLPFGNTTLELNKDWCPWWKPDCTFQIDIFIPKAKGSTWELDEQVKLAVGNEKKLRNKKWQHPETTIVPWLYLEGRHGEEWQYSWTGLHRKRGDKSEFTIGGSLSNKMKFSLFGIENSLTMSPNVEYKIFKTYNDIELGTDVSFYCGSFGPNWVPAPAGEFLSTGAVQFPTLEK